MTHGRICALIIFTRTLYIKFPIILCIKREICIYTAAQFKSENRINKYWINVFFLNLQSFDEHTSERLSIYKIQLIFQVIVIVDGAEWHAWLLTKISFSSENVAHTLSRGSLKTRRSWVNGPKSEYMCAVHWL